MANSVYYANKVLDATFRNVSLTITAAYISLHSADPVTTGAAEITGGGYARLAGAFTAAATKATATSAAMNFLNMPACTVTNFGVWDAATAGNFLWGGLLTAPKTLNSGDTFQFPTGQLAFSIST